MNILGLIEDDVGTLKSTYLPLAALIVNVHLYSRKLSDTGCQSGAITVRRALLTCESVSDRLLTTKLRPRIRNITIVQYYNITYQRRLPI